MKIYRVYRNFKDGHESGSVEYGYYSKKEVAEKRMKTVAEEINKHDYGGEGVMNYSDTCISISYWEHDYVQIEEIELDLDINNKNVVYT